MKSYSILMARASFDPTFRRSCLALGAVMCFAGAVASRGDTTLTHAREVLNLPAEVAKQGLPVKVRGIVTYTQPAWAGQFFVQDETGGIFVGHSGKQAPAIGQVVEVIGRSHPGAFAPFIEKPTWKVVGQAPLPQAQPVSMERFASGVDDGLRVEVSGRVRRVFRHSSGPWGAVLSSGGERFEVFINPERDGMPLPSAWVGSQVRMRGVLAADYQLHRRGMAMVRLFVASPDEVFIDQPEAHDPLKQDPVPLARVGQYRRDLAPGQRTRVRGVVVAVFGRENLALEDASGGLLIRGGELTGFKPGDPVEAIGFEGLENFLPVLQDSIVVKTGANTALPPVARPTVGELSQGKHHACLVGLEAELIEIVDRPAADGTGRGREVIMFLQCDGKIFKADFPDAAHESERLPFDVGSRVDLTGICLSEANREGRVDSFRLRLAGPSSVRVVMQPPFLNRQRLGIALASTLAGMALCGGWLGVSARRNRKLRADILEREKLTMELEDAKLQLSKRVDERTEQLKSQISARKESEVRFRAVIEERTRLAQELHDGVQQGLAGVSLQLDTASRLRERRPDLAIEHLELARTLMHQTQTELRNSVWNLRSRSREDFSLVEALRQSAQRFSDGTGIEVHVGESGHPAVLSELQEENLLRIGQEALTNAIKHSGASQVSIQMDWRPAEVCLRIADRGSGFDTHTVAGPARGHFGLSGMAERVQRIGGSLRVASEPGHGTVIEACLPVEPRAH